MTTTVVNVRGYSLAERDVLFRSGDAVYIGRPSKWGNPYTIGKDGGRDEVIESFRLWLYAESPAYTFDDVIAELKDKVLVCWCKPLACHGDVLAELADSE